MKESRHVLLGIVWVVAYLVTSANCKATPEILTSPNRTSKTMNPIVNTHSGKIRGQILETIWNKKSFSSFRGIPYAKPPIGNRRFKAPREAKHWNNVLDTLKDASPCPQLDFTSGWAYKGEENCLYLNVYTPITDFGTVNASGLPVMVFIPGGYYFSGSANSALYGPDFIIEEDVILVTLNYRLGALGFLSLNLTQAPGNAGLKDVNFALKWIRKNIANFGGDPKRVTIFGESAGGAIVDLLVVSDASKGLFQNAISMSAALFCPWAIHSTQDAVKRGLSLANLLNYNTTNATEILHQLYHEPVLNLVMSAVQLSKYDIAWKPSIEHPAVVEPKQAFLTECPMRKYTTRSFNQVPQMMGFMKNEAVFFSQRMDLEKFSNSIDQEDEKDIYAGYAQLLGDYSFISGIDEKFKILRNYSSQPIYYYRVSYESEHSLHRKMFGLNLPGAAHFDDIGYIFHTSIVDVPTNVNDPLSLFRKKMVRLWTNFAKYGNPTPSEHHDDLLNIQWTNAALTSQQMDIDEELKMIPRSASPVAKFLGAIIKENAEVLTGCTNPRQPTIAAPLVNTR